MLVGPNVMLMNIMACRVFRNTKFRNHQGMDLTITSTIPPRIPLQALNANSSATPALGDTQSRESQGAIEGGKLENGDVINICPSQKWI
jgi:hypothetical protein